MKTNRYVAVKEKDNLNFNITKIYTDKGDFVCEFPWYCQQPRKNCKQIKWNGQYHDVVWR